MAVHDTRIRLLGPFELMHDGHVVTVGGPVGQAILTALASRPNTKLLPSQLVSMVWGDPDVVTTDTLYHHLTKLRRALATIGLVIVGHRPGYQLTIAAEQVDVAQFDELLRGARALIGTDPDQATERLRAAVELWRGPRAVDNLTLSGIRRLAASWEARRWDAEEDLAEIELRRGRPDQVLDRLHTLVAAHPERPRLAAVLARAMHATGRADQAITVLDNADRAAGAAGQATHPALIQARQALSNAGPLPARYDSAPTVVPFQLPADTVHFTGRTEQLACLLSRCPGPGESGGPVTAVIGAVEGMAGVGKTALAVHAAHRLADQFADGVLFADLHGFTPETEPTPPEQVLDHLLRGLGVPGPQIPPDLDARVGLYRSVLARRRVLIVLDNAMDERQLQPLLPATPGCAAIVTSRRQLASLDDAAHLVLPVLDPAEAAGLFRRLAGDRTTAGDYQAVDRIVALCGHLPLAIRITAARLRLAPAATLTTLCAELEHALEVGWGLDWLSDGHRTVTAALAVSYQHLTPDQQHALRQAGLHPGTHLEPYAFAALADTTVESARRLLDDLYAASMVDQVAYRRYTLHDLVATYARTLADDLPDRQTSLDRLYDHYAAVSSEAVALTHPAEARRRPCPQTPGTAIPSLTSQQDAQCWLDIETDNLLSAAHHALRHCRGDHTLNQAATLFKHLRSRGYYAQAGQLHADAIGHAKATRDQRAELDALNRLGRIHFLQSKLDCATGYFEQALAIARQTGHRTGEQDALMGIGDIHYVQGRFGQAVDYFTEALDVARQLADRAGELCALNAIGIAHVSQGEHGLALDCLERALSMSRQIGERAGELAALIGIGHLHVARCEYSPAIGYFEQALTMSSQMGDRNGQLESHYGLGRAHQATGHLDEALRHHRMALQSAVTLDQSDDQARVHNALGHVHLALDAPHQARHHWQTALSLLARLGKDRTHDADVTTAAIRARLSDLDRQ